MNCELMMIGSELLLGQIVDTNAAYLAQRLAEIGVDIYYKTTVGDNQKRLVAALRLALERSDIVITSGGLGPTEDDLTREAVADVLGSPLEFHQELLDDIRAKFQSRGLTMSPNNRKQAFLPKAASVFRNPRGTAPAFVVESEEGTIVCLPGVPQELRQIMEAEVLPYLSKSFAANGSLILSRVLKASAVGESAVDQKIGGLIRTSKNPTLGILAQAGEILIRITAKARDRSTASAMLDEMELRVREHVGDHIFGKDQETLENVVTQVLESEAKTMCVVETGTGGAVAQRLVAANSRQVLGFEILPRVSGVSAFLSANNEPCENIPGDPCHLAQCLGDAARRKYGADVAVVVLEATRCALARSWVLVQDGKTEYVRDVGLKGCDSWSQHRLANVALEMTRRTLLKTVPVEQRRS